MLSGFCLGVATVCGIETYIRFFAQTTEEGEGLPARAIFTIVAIFGAILFA